MYLNDAGTGVETDQNGNQIGVDRNSSKGECMGDANHPGTGGYWVDGTANTLYLDPNSNAVALTGYEDGQNTQSPIYNLASQSTRVTASDPSEIAIQDVSLYTNIRGTFPGLKVQWQVRSNVSYSDAVSWCNAAALMAGGGTVPGAIPPTGPGVDTEPSRMETPSEKTRFANEKPHSEYPQMGPTERGNAFANAFAYGGNFSACVGAVTSGYR